MPNLAASRVAPAVRWTLFDSPEPFAALVMRETDGTLAGAINTAVVTPEQGEAVGAWAIEQLAAGHNRSVMFAHELPAARQCVKAAS